MCPDKRSKRGEQSRKPGSRVPAIRTRPSRDDAHEIVFFRRHKDDDPDESMPGRDFLTTCPKKVRATMRAVLIAVAAAPPHKFSGGGYWEVMRGRMAGWYEVRVDGPGRHHYRLFCRIDLAAEGAEKPLLVVIGGLDKPFGTTLAEKDYERIRRLGNEYLTRNPRSVI